MDPYISHRLPIGSSSFLFEVRSSLLWATGVKCCSHTWATLICRPFPTSPLCPFLPEWEALLSFLSLVFRFLSLHRFVPPSHSQVQNHVWPYGSPQTNTYKITFMFKYIYIYIHVYLHTHIIFYILLHLPISIEINLFTNMHAFYRLICTYIYTYLQTCFVCINACTYVHFTYFLQIRVHMYIIISLFCMNQFTYIYIYTLYMWYVFGRAWFLSANVKMDLLTPRWKSSLSIWSEAPMLWSVMLLSLSWVA